MGSEAWARASSVQRKRVELNSWPINAQQLAPAARLPVLAAAEIYGALLVKVRENGYDNHTKRAYTTTGEKLGALPGLVGRAWFGR